LNKITKHPFFALPPDKIYNHIIIFNLGSRVWQKSNSIH